MESFSQKWVWPGVTTSSFNPRRWRERQQVGKRAILGYADTRLVGRRNDDC
jgi:hypothetical protein